MTWLDAGLGGGALVAAEGALLAGEAFVAEEGVFGADFAVEGVLGEGLAGEGEGAEVSAAGWSDEPGLSPVVVESAQRGVVVAMVRIKFRRLAGAWKRCAAKERGRTGRGPAVRRRRARGALWARSRVGKTIAI